MPNAIKANNMKFSPKVAGIVETEFGPWVNFVSRVPTRTLSANWLAVSFEVMLPPERNSMPEDWASVIPLIGVKSVSSR